MHLERFVDWFPELGAKECRTLKLLDDPIPSPDRLRPGSYTFIELYCTDPKCDCRRVCLQVHYEQQRRPLATISFGFDRDAEMAGPFLDPLHYQCQSANELLQLTEDLLFSDPRYVARLERHYYLIKEAAGMHPARLPLAIDPADVDRVIQEKKDRRRQRQKLLNRLSPPRQKRR